MEAAILIQSEITRDGRTGILQLGALRSSVTPQQQLIYDSAQRSNDLSKSEVICAVAGTAVYLSSALGSHSLALSGLPASASVSST